jgi:hypothetical protein
VVKVFSVQKLSLPNDDYYCPTHLFRQFIMIKAGDDRLKVVDVTTSEILLTFKHSRGIYDLLIAKTSDPMTVVAVFKDDYDNYNCVAIDLLTLNSRLLHSLSNEEYSWVYLYKPVIEEKIEDGKVKQILIRHTVYNNKTHKRELMEIRLKK